MSILAHGPLVSVLTKVLQKFDTSSDILIFDMDEMENQ